MSNLRHVIISVMPYGKKIKLQMALKSLFCLKVYIVQELYTNVHIIIH